ncbi:HAMP domain-containing protein [Bosea caraganae]|uniref:Signal transduction histidine-protein kinase/phosphatase MprB n=1 Tax=Bosea caraganae TaxID=2763117 RepID=A0A370L7A3_9HYPH|nr:ATP-binding protein [Bosea caraganae]RDJ25491.1 HAMP domain-containing protein [Bosea caraganae]RDJ25723.1 HAMP domain-containing protein [Bosea caraganae]
MAPVRRKWRPTLSMIVFVVLVTVTMLPLIGLFFFRLYENQLIHQTESELIAQTAAIAAIYAREVEADPAARALARPAGSQAPTRDEYRSLAAREQAMRTPVGDYHPIEPSLDLAGDDILPRRPDAREPAKPADPAFLAIGARLAGIVTATQDVTLAGFRILDPNGTVIAGREELGRSLADVEEVATALRGRYGNALRVRISNSPAPPLYSWSRGTGIRVFVAMPVMVDQAVAGVVYASRTPNNIFKHLFAERRKVIFAGLAIALVTALIGFVFARTITRPIHGLIAQTQAIGHGERAQEPPPAHYGTREIASLSQSFHEMAERLSERSAYISTFATHVSHELKSPLTSIQGAAELMKDSSASMSEEQRQRFLGNIIDDTHRLTRLLDRLRELARADNPQMAGSTTLQAVVGLVRDAFPALIITVEGEPESVLGLSPDNALIVLSHLADNAQRHNAKNLRIAARQVNDRLELRVSDDGDGIAASNRGRIFDPFFTTRRESGGTGMGLGIAQSMLRSHDGAIALEPSEAGTAFTIRLPWAGCGGMPA